jgi:DNA-binding response OmpR family regulator
MSETRKPQEPRILKLPNGEQVRVLVIDDDVFISGIYVLSLENAGIAVEVARDGVAGIKQAHEFKPHVIILDVMMPVMDGFETLERLKKQKATRGTPVLMLTSLTQKEDVARGQELGAADYLKKTETLPIEALAKIKKVLGLA